MEEEEDTTRRRCVYGRGQRIRDAYEGSETTTRAAGAIRQSKVSTMTTGVSEEEDDHEDYYNNNGCVRRV